MRLFLGLGSNLGNRWAYLQAAVAGLRPYMSITAISPVYETVPWGPEPEQPLFLNACVEAQTTLGADVLLPAIRQLEKELGRKGSGKWGPHEIDIDLLFYGDLVTKVGSRTIPHRQIRQRPFVLCPLADIAPDFIHPVHQMTIVNLLREVDSKGIVRLPRSLMGVAIPEPVL